MISKARHSGIIIIRKVNKKTNEIIKRSVLFNQITNIALDELIKPLYGDTPDSQLAYLAVGSGTNTPSATDTTLQSEEFRTADTSLSRTDTGQVTSEYVLSGSDYIAEVASGEIEEIGFFAGSSALPWGAGAGVDTGLLISRILFSETITADEDIYFQRADTITA